MSHRSSILRARSAVASVVPLALGCVATIAVGIPMYAARHAQSTFGAGDPSIALSGSVMLLIGAAVAMLHGRRRYAAAIGAWFGIMTGTLLAIGSIPPTIPYAVDVATATVALFAALGLAVGAFLDTTAYLVRSI